MEIKQIEKSQVNIKSVSIPQSATGISTIKLVCEFIPDIVYVELLMFIDADTELPSAAVAYIDDGTAIASSLNSNINLYAAQISGLSISAIQNLQNSLSQKFIFQNHSRKDIRGSHKVTFSHINSGTTIKTAHNLRGLLIITYIQHEF